MSEDASSFITLLIPRVIPEIYDHFVYLEQTLRSREKVRHFLQPEEFMVESHARFVTVEHKPLNSGEAIELKIKIWMAIQTYEQDGKPGRLLMCPDWVMREVVEVLVDIFPHDPAGKPRILWIRGPRVNPTSNKRLSATQEEVARLIEAGNTNREIASALSISEGTVRVHVRAILDRLGVTSRSKAAVILRQRHSSSS